MGDVTTRVTGNTIVLPTPLKIKHTKHYYKGDT